MRSVVDSWGRLLRISLSATAVADVLAGLVVAGGGLLPVVPTLTLVGASLCVYHGGMALNDWADRETDAKVRPDRPIPSGRISANTALAAALSLMIAGPCLAASVSSAAGLWVAGIALCAAAYDLFGRGAWLGPLLLGLCRAANLSIGFLAQGEDLPEPTAAWSAPLLYGVYVFVLSRLGRFEDGEATAARRKTPSRLLQLLAAIFWVLPALPVVTATPLGRAAALALGAAASVGLWREARRLSGEWKPHQVIPAMGCALRRMLIFSAALAVLPGTLESASVAVLILGLYPMAWYLRRAFPPS